jgi:hypothetical protein
MLVFLKKRAAWNFSIVEYLPCVIHPKKDQPIYLIGDSTIRWSLNCNMVAFLSCNQILNFYNYLSYCDDKSSP